MKTTSLAIALALIGAWRAGSAVADSGDGRAVETRPGGPAVRLVDFDLDDIEDFFDDMDDHRFDRRLRRGWYGYPYQSHGFYPGYSYDGYPRSWGFSVPYFSFYFSRPTPDYYSSPAVPYPADPGVLSPAWPGVEINPPVAPVTVRSLVVNPETNGVALKYRVNGVSHSIAPGESQEFAAPGQVIEFDRGGGTGLARYALSGGVYTFTPTEHGWELYRSPLEPTEQSLDSGTSESDAAGTGSRGRAL